MIEKWYKKYYVIRKANHPYTCSFWYQIPLLWDFSDCLYIKGIRLENKGKVKWNLTISYIAVWFYLEFYHLTINV